MKTMLLLVIMASGWSAGNTALQSAVVVAGVADIMQTRYGLSQGYIEANPLYGSRPSAKRLYGVFAALSVANAAVAYLLPEPYRTVFQCISAGVHVASISHNAVLFGLHFKL